MGLPAKDAGESESLSVMGRIGVQTLPPAKVGTLCVQRVLNDRRSEAVGNGMLRRYGGGSDHWRGLASPFGDDQPSHRVLSRFLSQNWSETGFCKGAYQCLSRVLGNRPARFFGGGGWQQSPATRLKVGSPAMILVIVGTFANPQSAQALI